MGKNSQILCLVVKTTVNTKPSAWKMTRDEVNGVITGGLQ